MDAEQVRVLAVGSAGQSVLSRYLRAACVHCSGVQTVETDSGGEPFCCQQCGEYGVVPKGRFAPQVVVGDFILRQPLGDGLRGPVYLAWQRSLERLCAVKFLVDDEPLEESVFLTEAKAAARLLHPNLVQCLAVGHSGECYYYAMEYVKGDTLATLIQQQTLKPGVALDYASRLALALAHVWRLHRVAHRHINPKNIMITEDGEVKLAEMGLSRNEGRKGLVAGDRLPHDHYTSPEVRRGEAGDFRSDIFSLGIVLTEAITGRNPYAELTDSQACSGQFTLANASELASHLPEAVGRLLARMTAACPESRHGSYEILLDELDAARLHCPASVLHQQHLRFLADGGAAKPAANRWRGGASLALAASVAIFAGSLLVNWPSLWRPAMGDTTADETSTDHAMASRLALETALVRIAALLPDPVGYDAGQETVTLRQVGEARTVSLAGMDLRVGGRQHPLVGQLQPGASLLVRLPGDTIVLPNTGGAVQLVGPEGQLVDQVSYSAVDVVVGREIVYLLEEANERPIDQP